MDWIHNIFHKSPEIALFLSLAVGYFIGQINFGKFQLGGVGGSLLAAVVISQAGVSIDNGVKAVMFAVFIYAVGYDSGPGFFNSLNRRTLNPLGAAWPPMPSGVICRVRFCLLLRLSRQRS